MRTFAIVLNILWIIVAILTGFGIEGHRAAVQWLIVLALVVTAVVNLITLNRPNPP